MATGLTVIKRALRLIGVLDGNEAPEPEMAEDAVATLNAMIARWQRDGLGLAWIPLENSASELVVQSEAIEPIVFNLAVKLSSEYAGQLTQAVIATASDGYKAILRDSTGIAHADLDSMPTGSGGYVSDVYGD